MSTIFAQIISGEAPADIVYQDEWVTCFKDIAPMAPIHLLIIPNSEIPTLNDVDDSHQQLLGHMLLVAKKLAHEQGIAESGYRLVIQCNDDGGQMVYHLHMHLLGGEKLARMA